MSYGSGLSSIATAPYAPIAQPPVVHAAPAMLGMVGQAAFLPGGAENSLAMHHFAMCQAAQQEQIHQAQQQQMHELQEFQRHNRAQSQQLQPHRLEPQQLSGQQAHASRSHAVPELRATEAPLHQPVYPSCMPVLAAPMQQVPAEMLQPFMYGLMPMLSPGAVGLAELSQLAGCYAGAAPSFPYDSGNGADASAFLGVPVLQPSGMMLQHVQTVLPALEGEVGGVLDPSHVVGASAYAPHAHMCSFDGALQMSDPRSVSFDVGRSYDAVAAYAASAGSLPSQRDTFLSTALGGAYSLPYPVPAQLAPHCGGFHLGEAAHGVPLLAEGAALHAQQQTQQHALATAQVREAGLLHCQANGGYMPLNLDYPGLRRVHDAPPMYIVDGFLSDAECEALITVASPLLQRSKTHAAAGPEATRGRTSLTCHLAKTTMPCPMLLSKVHALTGKPFGHMELPQVARYTEGQRYVEHYDGVDPHCIAGRAFCALGGQRVATVLMYLNDVPEGGGGTFFRRLNLEIKPRRGSAVIFFPGFMNGELDMDALHAGMPPLGTKWVSQVWIRQSFREDGQPSVPVPETEQALIGPLHEGVYRGHCLAGDDVHQAVMTFEQAKAFASAHPGVQGFTYKSNVRHPEEPTHVWFKSRMRVLYNEEWWSYSLGNAV